MTRNCEERKNKKKKEEEQKSPHVQTHMNGGKRNSAECEKNRKVANHEYFIFYHSDISYVIGICSVRGATT